MNLGHRLQQRTRTRAVLS